MAYAMRHPESIERLVVMNTAAFLPPHGKRIPIRLKIIRNFKPFANIAVLGLNLFAYIGPIYGFPQRPVQGG